MALTAYMTVQGPNGPIEGTTSAAAHQGKIEVWSVHHEVGSDFDPASIGGAVGRTEHRPLRITKPVDQASPLLIEAALTPTTLPEVVLELYVLDATGVEVLDYRIQLVDAAVASVRTEMLDNRYVDNEDQPVKEIVSFVYARIRWIHEGSGFSAEDNLVGS